MGVTDASSTPESKKAVGPDSYGLFWSQNNGTQLHNTFQIKNLSSETGDVLIKCNWGSYFYLGGLIVDESDKSYRVGREEGSTATKQSIVFLAGTGETVKSYIGSDTKLVGQSVILKNNGDWKVRKGKALTFEGNSDSTFTIDGVSLSLEAYGTDEAEASVDVSMGLSVAETACVTVDSGVNLTIGGVLTGSSGGSVSRSIGGEGTLTLAGGAQYIGSISVASVVYESSTTNGSLSGQLSMGCLEKKDGDSTLTLSGFSESGPSIGTISIAQGRVEITSASGTGSQTVKVATDVEVNAASTNVSSTFLLSGSGGTYTVEKLKLAGLGATASSTGISPTANVEVGSGVTLVVSGKEEDGSAVALDLTEGAGVVKGGGKVQLNGTVKGSNALKVAGDGTQLEVDAAWGADDFTGGLYLSANGTVVLGADVSVGYLAGTSQGDAGYWGNIILKDGQEHTITIKNTTGTATNASAANIHLATGVTLELAASSTQTITHLCGVGGAAGGKLKLGQNSKLYLHNGPDAGDTNSIASAEISGELHVYNGANVCELTVSGDLTTNGGSIFLGYGDNVSNVSSKITVDGNLVLEGSPSARELYIHKGEVIVRGTITGEGTSGGDQITIVREGKLIVEGGSETGGEYKGVLRLGTAGNNGVKLGKQSSEGWLVVAGLNHETTRQDGNNRNKIEGNGTLALNVVSDKTATGARLKLMSGVTLLKKGNAVQTLDFIDASEDGSHVKVKDGVLKFDGTGTVSLHDVAVDGNGSVLEFGRGGTAVTVGGEGDQVTLANGGTLKSSYNGTAETTYNFGALNIGEGSDAGEITFSASANARQTFTFNGLTGNGSISIAAMGGDANKQRVINLGKINGYSGAFTVAATDENNVLTIGGEIISGDSAGSISVTGDGAVTVNGSSTVKKTGGTGTFTISHLKLTSAQSLQMDYEGGALSITKLTLAAGSQLVYTEKAVQDGGSANLVNLPWSDLASLFTDGFGGKVGLRLDFAASAELADELFLGITASNDPTSNWTAEKLSDFFDNGAGGGVNLSWKQEDDVWKLYLSLDNYEEALHYWDPIWGEGEVDNGPSNKQMSLMAGKWYTSGGEGDAWYGILGNNKDTAGGSFTAKCLDLSGDAEGKWLYNSTVFVRLEKGSTVDGINEQGTKLTILGGKLYNDASAGTSGGMLERRVYISLWAQQGEHFHLLAGGSSFVQTADAATNLGFKGNTHIQVQGGTVDHIVGGNHVTNKPATFTGDTYISIFEGAQGLDENGDPNGELQQGCGTDVRGGIVGGSTVTASGASGEEGTYDFEGHSHIYIYTVLKGRRDETTHKATTIPNGDSNAANDPELYHIVGGNAWIGSTAAGTGGEQQNMVFFGSSAITVDLSKYEDFYERADDRGGDSFEKAIVGGNFSGEEATSGASTTTTFSYNGEGGYATVIDITGTYVKEDETREVAFWGGINGASRRDNAGGSVTNYTATGSQGILIDLKGGAYRNMVAGGFWFGGTRSGDVGSPDTGGEYSGALTGNVTVNLKGGEYWRVAGGNYSNGGAYKTADDGEGAGGTLGGNTVVTVTDGARFGLGYDLSTREQATETSQSAVAALVGGSFLENTTGSHTQTGTATLNVTDGGFDNAHIVAGDYVLYSDAAGEKTYNVSIQGGTELTLGGDSSRVIVNGLVVGGSFVSDTTQGGSASIGIHSEEEGGETQAVTHVVVNGGVVLNAETDSEGNSLHDGVALVGGSVLIDESAGESSGSHTLNIHGGTEIELKGGEINGLVVGGSYSALSQKGTPNELNIEGNSSITITGSTVNGNIIGGHFSANTGSPDTLKLGNVNITLDGGTVTGHIFGGSMRRCLTSAAEAPTQEEITVSLKSGKLWGGVYAAGNHYQTGDEASLNVRTKSTRVEVYGGFKLYQMQYGETKAEVGISGGYLRNIAEYSQGSGNANDYSTVGYDEDFGTWSEQAATLAFMAGAGEIGGDFSSLTDLGTHLHLQDFDAVEVEKGLNVDMHGSTLLVMHKLSSDGDKGGHDTFTKTGKGNLTLAALKSWHAQEGENGQRSDYTGRIILDQGNLTLVGDTAMGYTKQSLEGGLTIKMDGRSFGNKDDAYLKGGENMQFTRGALGDGGKIQVKLQLTEGSQLDIGVYYLVDGLDMTDFESEEDFDFNQEELKGPGGDVSFSLEVKDGNKLVLRVHKDAPDQWYWEGGEGNTWTQSQPKEEMVEDWTMEAGNVDDDPGNDTYYFTAGAEDMNVQVDGSVTAAEVRVQGGDYVFTQKGSGKGIALTGALVVGSVGGSSGEAHVRLELANEAIPTVELLEDGVLELGHAQAIRKTTKLQFKGGTLMYGENEKGSLVVDTDLAGQVKAVENDAKAVRIQVGESAAAVGKARAAGAAVPKVTWSGTATTTGVQQIVEHGLITGGRGIFSLNLNAAGGSAGGSLEIKGTLEAEEGTQELRVSGLTASIQAPEESGGSLLSAAEGARIRLVAQGKGSGITVNRAFSGTGVIEIGSADDDGGTYELAANSKDALGTVRLTGNSTTSSVTLKTANALGGEGTTLELAGRNVVAEGTEAASITAKTINVAADTTTLIGGASGSQKEYTLTAESISGSGVLGNAQGGFRGTLEGDTADFEGVIVAGMNGRGSGAESTWTLSGKLGQTGTVAASLAGTGRVILEYDTGEVKKTDEKKLVRLTGKVGDETLGGSVDVEHKMDGAVLVLAGGVRGAGMAAQAVNDSTGDLVFNGHEIWLGDDDSAGSWSGGLSAGESSGGAAGAFVLRRGVLAQAVVSAPEGVAMRVDTARGDAKNLAWVNAGDTQGSCFSDITINAYGRLRHVSSGFTVDGDHELHLTISEDNLDDAAGAEGKYLMDLGGDLRVQQVKKAGDDSTSYVFELNLSSEALVETLKRHRNDNVQTFLHLVTGGNIVFEGDQKQHLDELMRSGNYTPLLAGIGFTVGVEGGDLTLAGSSKDVYIVFNPKTDTLHQSDPDTVTDPDSINEKKAVLVDSGATLTLRDEDAGASESKEFTLHNLVGLGNSTLKAGDADNPDKLEVTLDNSTVLPAQDERENDGWLDDKTGDPAIYDKLQGLDTEFAGTIVGYGEDVNFTKKGAGTLTVGSADTPGGLKIDGSLTLKEGAVHLLGQKKSNSRLGTLVFGYDEGAQQADEERGLTLDGARLTVNSITPGTGDTTSNRVDMKRGGELVFAGNNESAALENMHFASSDQTGTLCVENETSKLVLADGSDIRDANVRLSYGGTLALTGDALLQEVGEVNLQAATGAGNEPVSKFGTLDLSQSTEEHSARSLVGNGKLTGKAATPEKEDAPAVEGSSLSIIGEPGKDADGNVKAFSGILEGGGQLTVTEDAELVLDHVTTQTSASSPGYWSVTAEEDSRFTLDSSQSKSSAHFGAVTLEGGSNTTLRVNTDDASGRGTPTFSSFLVGDAANITLESTGNMPLTGENEVRFAHVENPDQSSISGSVQVQVKGLAFLHSEVESFGMNDAGNAVVLKLKEAEYNKFARALPKMEKNPVAGATMFWSASAPSPDEALYEALMNPNSDFHQMVNGLSMMLDSGDANGLAHALAAGAGSSISTIGPALAEDMHRQLKAMRNRTTTMGGEMRYDGYDNLPLWHAWISGEGGYHKMDADSFAPGYTLNNWGGTVGVDVDVSAQRTLGLALSAMYGNLKPDSADSATGHLDTMYLSAFLRAGSGRWIHTFVVSGGLADVKLDRTVNYGGGSYRTKGSTDGYALGALYEVGYTGFTNKKGTLALQPVFNVEVRHAGISGYNETGSDAGLRVDDMEQSVVTFGVGARMQGIVGRNTFNRASIFEARLLLKADAGDRSGTARNGIIGSATMAEVESAEVGAVGVEVGAGLTVPLGSQSGSLFLDASLEYRSGWTSANASAGYRVDF